MNGIGLDFDDPKLQDPIEEVYAVRRAISAKYGHDIHKIFVAISELQRAEEAKGRKYVRLPIARLGEPCKYPPAPDGGDVLCACELEPDR